MVALSVHFRRCFEYTLWAELYAEFATLTPIRYKINLTAWNMDFPDVERPTIECSHQQILSIRLPPLLHSHYTRDTMQGQYL